jgi:enoyl-CoA hydratase/carnithine racemase
MLDRETQAALAGAWNAFEDNDGLLIAVLHGAAADFCLGHDRAELKAGASPLPEDGIFPLGLTKPVVAAIEGRCHGLGFELALSCDLRVADEGASLGFPDADLAVPYRLASVLLPRQTFSGLGFELLFTGRTLSAGEAKEARLVNEVAPLGTALAAAMELAARLAARFPGPGAFHKRPLLRASGLPLAHAMAVAREAAP